MKQLLLNFLVHISFPLKYAYHGMVLYTKVKSMILSKAKIKFNYCPRYLSDKGQDRWVINEIFKGKRFGYFLDIGAADGFSTSNTFILETRYDWNGLCVEPNPILYNQMVTQHNREAVCVRECIDQIEHEIEFIIDGKWSGIIHDQMDNNEIERKKKIDKSRILNHTLKLKTTTLNNLLEKYNAPRIIDYFSLDIEGAETRVFREFPFDKYTFLSMTIERPSKELNDLLFNNGYVFIKNNIYDTFYIHKSIDNFNKITKGNFSQVVPKEF